MNWFKLMCTVDDPSSVVTGLKVGSNDLTEVLKAMMVSVSEEIVAFSSEILVGWFFNWQCRQ